MPQAFDDCVKNGGNVRIEKVATSTGVYRRVCYDGQGRRIAGEAEQVQGK